MTFSLWRDNERLGDVVARFPNEPPHGVYGLFRPTSALADIGHLMQSRVALLPGSPVFLSRFTGKPNPGPVDLQLLSPDEARGIPPDQQLVLRDDDGQPVDVDTISIDPLEVSPEPGELPDLCRACGFDERAWLLGAFRHPRSQRNG